MELRQLEYFVAVAEEANFTRAAERVHISQSGVSAQIRQLERDLGVTLFDRSRRAATLTEAGAAALGPARDALSAVERVRRAVDDVSELVKGQLVVGMVTACTVTPLFDALAAFHAAYPGVLISLVENESDRLVQAVRDGSIDMALVGVAASAPEGLESLTIVSEGLVAVVGPDHPLAGRADVPLREVCSYPIVSLPEGTGIRAVFDQSCAAQGVDADVALQASAPDAVADLAARGMGVGILSESMAFGADDQLSVCLINDIEVDAVLALTWRTPTSPALRGLLVHCRGAFAGVAA